MKKFLLLSFTLFLSSCAPAIHSIQPQVNSHLMAHQYDEALSSLGNNPLVYGKKNELLYWLDRGFILHVAGRYRESIDAFERAKYKFDQLYTVSVHEIAGSFLINDYRESYRGHDAEYVWVNIFQALNYAALGDIHESLVEARQVDMKLRLVNDRYKDNPKNVYRDDAFARMLMGILYQADGGVQAEDDSRISFAQATGVYQRDYSSNYGLTAPNLLNRVKEPLEPSKAYVYLIQYTGFAPTKIPNDIYLPAGGLLFTKISFPSYIDHPSAFSQSSFVAHGKYTDVVYPTEVGEGIGSIAKQILENRKLLLGAKSVLRPGMKVAGEKVIGHQVEQQYGDLAALGVDLLGTLYNLTTEQADLRSWETLPNEIRIARLVLEPGEYQFYVQNSDHYGNLVEKKDLGTIDIKAGDKKFFIVRTYL